MDIKKALLSFKALSQETRLKTFKLLISFGNGGCPACLISKKMNIPQNTLSFHLSVLSNANLVKSKRKGRQIIYMANLNHIQKLMLFIIKNCCSNEINNCEFNNLIKHIII